MEHAHMRLPSRVHPLVQGSQEPHTQGTKPVGRVQRAPFPQAPSPAPLILAVQAGVACTRGQKVR